MVAIADGSDDADALTARLRSALSAFGSETPDNADCVERLEVDGVSLKLKESACSLAEIAWRLEEQDMPASLKQALPQLTDADWAAFLRLTTLLYVAMDRSEQTT